MGRAGQMNQLFQAKRAHNMNLLVFSDNHQVTAITELNLPGVFELVKCVELAQRRLIRCRLMHYMVKFCVIKQAHSQVIARGVESCALQGLLCHLICAVINQAEIYRDFTSFSRVVPYFQRLVEGRAGHDDWTLETVVQVSDFSGVESSR